MKKLVVSLVALSLTLAAPAMAAKPVHAAITAATCTAQPQENAKVRWQSTASWTGKANYVAFSMDGRTQFLNFTSSGVFSASISTTNEASANTLTIKLLDRKLKSLATKTITCDMKGLGTYLKWLDPAYSLDLKFTSVGGAQTIALLHDSAQYFDFVGGSDVSIYLAGSPNGTALDANELIVGYIAVGTAPAVMTLCPFRTVTVLGVSHGQYDCASVPAHSFIMVKNNWDTGW